MAGTVGARGVVTQHPLISTIENAGKAFKDMGNLFNQTRQARAYEKSVENQQWQNVVGATLDLYDRAAEFLDPMGLQKTFAPMFEELLVSGGLGRQQVKALSKKITDYDLNFAAVLDRVRADAVMDWVEGGGLDSGKTEDLVNKEVDRKRQEEALQQVAAEAAGEKPTTMEDQPSQAGQRGWPWTEPDEKVKPTPRARPIPPEAQPQTPWEDQPGATHEFLKGPAAPEPFTGASQTQPQGRLTPENVEATMSEYLKLTTPAEKTRFLTQMYPEIRTITDRIRISFELMVRGVRKDDSALKLKALKLWEQEMLKEATP